MNLRAQDNYEQRLIDVEWEDNNTTKDYIAHIDIYGLNRAGLLNDVLQVLSNTAKMISTVNAQPTKDMKFANIHISFGIPNLSMLTTVVDKIKSVPEVYSVNTVAATQLSFIASLALSTVFVSLPCLMSIFFEEGRTCSKSFITWLARRLRLMFFRRAAVNAR